MASVLRRRLALRELLGTALEYSYPAARPLGCGGPALDAEGSAASALLPEPAASLRACQHNTPAFGRLIGLHSSQGIAGRSLVARRECHSRSGASDEAHLSTSLPASETAHGAPKDSHSPVRPSSSQPAWPAADSHPSPNPPWGSKAAPILNAAAPPGSRSYAAARCSTPSPAVPAPSPPLPASGPEHAAPISSGRQPAAPVSAHVPRRFSLSSSRPGVKPRSGASVQEVDVQVTDSRPFHCVCSQHVSTASCGGGQKHASWVKRSALPWHVHDSAGDPGPGQDEQLV
jgi:hypothetical protein